MNGWYDVLVWLLGNEGVATLWLLVPGTVLLLTAGLLRYRVEVVLALEVIEKNHGFRMDAPSWFDRQCAEVYRMHKTSYSIATMAMIVLAHITVLAWSIIAFGAALGIIFAILGFLPLEVALYRRLNIEAGADSIARSMVEGGLLDEKRDKWIADVYGSDKFEELVERTLDEFEAPNPHRPRWATEEWAANKNRLLLREDGVGTAFRDILVRWHEQRTGARSGSVNQGS